MDLNRVDRNEAPFFMSEADSAHWFHRYYWQQKFNSHKTLK